MTYPPGVQLATLTFSNPSTFLGNEATRTETTVQSTAGVVWSATGQPIDDFEEVVSPGAGMPGSLTVPFVDQPGFTDQAGNVFNNWAYIVTRKTIFGNKVKTVRKNWQPTIGQDNVDFDNLPGGTIGLPVSVPQVAVTSVAGLTLAVGAADLAGELAPFLPGDEITPEAVAANLPARLGEVELDATYALKGDAGIAPEDSGYDLIIVAGQSNAQGMATGYDVARVDVPDPRVYTFNYSGTYANTIALAQDPLVHQNASNTAGPGMTFARWYAGAIKSNRKVLIVPVAFQGTGFSPDTDGTWLVPEGVLYMNAIAQTQAALTAAGANSRIAAILWVQGEHDASDYTEAQYAGYLDQLIDGFRALPTAADASFVIGQMVPEFIAGLSGYATAAQGQRINLAHINTQSRKTLAGFGYGIAGKQIGDNLHYDIVGQRHLGRSMFEAYVRSRYNVLGVAPSAPEGLSLAQSTGGLTATWERPLSRVTDYNVQYRQGTAGAWLDLTRTATPDKSSAITGLTAGQAYEVQVRAVNEAGVSAWTVPASITLALAPAQVTGLTAGTATGNSQPLTWSATTGAATYKVEYKATSSGTWLTAGTPTAASYTVTGLTATTSYDYRVSAVNGAGTGTVSATVTAVTDVPSPTVSDNFNRADGPMGVTPVGSKTWAVTGSAVMTISANQARVTSGSGIGAALVPVDSANGTYKATLKAVSGSAATMIAGLAFRATDSANALMVALRSTSTIAEYTLASRVGGTTTTIQATGIIPAADDVIQVDLSGDNIVVKINGVTAITTTSTVLNTIPKGGLYINGSDTFTAWDDWSYTPA